MPWGIISTRHDLSLSKQCATLSMTRASIYYIPKGDRKENLVMMRKINDKHIGHHGKGTAGMTDLLLEANYEVGLKILMKKL
jgi:hypothetical protein